MTNHCPSVGNRWKETLGSDPYEWQFITQHCFPVLSLGFRGPCAVAILAASANLTPIARWRYDRKISASGRSELSRLHYRCWDARNGHTKDTIRLFHGPRHHPVGDHICVQSFRMWNRLSFHPFFKSDKYFKYAKAMQINRILKISLIWHVMLNQFQKR